MDIFKNRRFVILGIFASIFIIYGIKLFYIQMIDDKYEELANQNAGHLTVELLLNGETVTGDKQPVAPASEIPCGSPPEDAYGVFYVAQLAPLGPGTYVAQVTWSLDEAVTDGYDADGDGQPNWYGPGVVFTHEFTINVQ